MNSEVQGGWATCQGQIASKCWSWDSSCDLGLRVSSRKLTPFLSGQGLPGVPCKLEGLEGLSVLTFCLPAPLTPWSHPGREMFPLCRWLYLEPDSWLFLLLPCLGKCVHFIYHPPPQPPPPFHFSSISRCTHTPFLKSPSLSFCMSLSLSPCLVTSESLCLCHLTASLPPSLLSLLFLPSPLH